jgi:riboflavin kinase / FMN adenylyltransferase
LYYDHLEKGANMRTIETIHEIGQLPRGLVLSIGNFDGLHRGHQAILAAAKKEAHERQTGVAVMTFDPHPVAILRPDKAPGVLTPLAQKKRLLQAAGVDYLIVIRDSFSLLNLSPADFVDDFLMSHLSPSVIVEGVNFNFGYGRSGTVETLRTLGADRGFEVIEVPFAQMHLGKDRRQVVCSSSTVRHLLETGDVYDAAQMLTRPYRLMGTVVAGRGIGRKLGYPTANVHPAGQILPAEGVYAGYVVVGQSMEEVCFGGLRRPAALSIGRAKTFVSEQPLLLEAHLIEENVENLYGKWIGLDFMGWIRHQSRFASQEALADQIEQDCRDALSVLI